MERPAIIMRKIEWRNIIFLLYILIGGFLLLFPGVREAVIYYVLLVIFMVLGFTTLFNEFFDVEKIGLRFWHNTFLKNVQLTTGSCLLALVLLLGSTGVTNIISPVPPSFQGMEVMGYTIGPEADIGLNTYMIAPIEETFFNGFVMTVLSGIGLWPANIIKSICFSIYHVIAWGGAAAGPLAYLQGIIFSLIGGFIAWKWGILTSWAFHSTWNNIIKLILGGFAYANVLGVIISMVLILAAVGIIQIGKRRREG